MRRHHSMEPVLRKQKPPRKSARISTSTDIQRKQINADLQASEIRYRRLFEAAQDGILILDANTGRITDVNPFLVKLLRRPRKNFLGKELWEIGLFRDAEKSRMAFKELQQSGYIRYEDLPLETQEGRYIDVEFVSNGYQAGGMKVIQCNIRDITERKHAEVEKAVLETIEKEQQRIGQDLHDGLCQQLAGVALLAKALAQKLSLVAPNESDDASEIAGLISQSVDQTRDVARGLAPVEIEAAGLAPALQKLAATVERLHHISCVFGFDEIMWFNHSHKPLLTTHLYRIAQEAVNNAIHHGKAKHITITLITVQNQGLMTIRDDGVGFPADFDENPGLGLRSMRHRCKMINAQLKVTPILSGGTVIACSFPHEAEQKVQKNEKN